MIKKYLEDFYVDKCELNNDDLEKIREIKRKYIQCHNYYMAALTRDLEVKTQEIIDYVNSKNEQS